MSTSSDEKVLIIGAGIGGLALAQALRKHGIAYEIFERDHSAGSRKQGWAIAIMESLPSLAELLPPDLGDIYQTSVNAGMHVDDQIAIIDLETGEPIDVLGGPKDSPKHFLRAGRLALRNYLWNHVSVTTGKSFSRYEEDENGVTAYFTDGSSARGSMLVGADGASSHVRQQLLGVGADLSSYVPISGEVTLTKEQYTPLAKFANAGLVGGKQRMRFFIGRRSIAPDAQNADYFFSLCLYSDDPEKDAAWSHSASRQELYDKALDAVQGLPDYIAQIVPLTGVQGMVTPPIRFLEFVPPSVIPSGRVTLLGDAAHVMVPFKGAGANTAVLDAGDLANLIIDQFHQKDGWDWIKLVNHYNGIMAERGRRLVLGSRAAGQQTDAAHVTERQSLSNIYKHNS